MADKEITPRVELTNRLFDFMSFENVQTIIPLIDAYALQCRAEERERCLERADSQNKAKLYEAFPEIYDRYDHMLSQAKKEQP
jgi:hypothetical protein